MSQAITSIKDALTQPEQEPVATVAEVHMSRYTIEWTNGPLQEGTKLYTAPPKRPWVGLTEDEILDVFKEKNAMKFARNIEAKLKSKNA